MSVLKTVYDKFGGKRHFIDGRPATQAEVDAAFPAKPLGVPMHGGNTSSAWPLYSDALAVHPSQIEQARARNRKRGVAVDYLPDGRAILTDRGARRDLMKLEGVHDNHGGYGDDTGSGSPIERPESKPEYIE